MAKPTKPKSKTAPKTTPKTTLKTAASPASKPSLANFSLTSDSDAKSLATPFRMLPNGAAHNADPYESEIAPSLLSADDIAKYIQKTGMVCPFVQTRDGKSKLKAASYEGGIGSCAYTFEPGSNTPKKIFSEEDKFLILPPNSIVFVESDIYFRLPPFIAVRFNLQIRLVHRGLLLGTGPLVDPGFWGKLCIPLHNLTDEEYVIPRNEGLIWIEFTKTTSYPELGTHPSNRDLKNIKKAITKASSPFEEVVAEYNNRNSTERILDRILPNGRKPPTPVGIRSSIQTKFLEAAKNSKTAMKAAKRASRTGYVVGGTSILSVLGLWTTYYKDTNSQHDKLRPRVASIEKSISNHLDSIETSDETNSETKNILSNATNRHKENEERIRLLEEKLEMQSNDSAMAIKRLEEQISEMQNAIVPD